MIRLGNLNYSNCVPIHGPLLESPPLPAWLAIRDGTPAELNAALARGELDVTPASSIELARCRGEYLALAGLCIASHGAVESVALVSRAGLSDLGGLGVAVPTDSASARCLLRILLELRLGVRPRWVEFRQDEGDPLDGDDVAAALYIGDRALRRSTRPAEVRYDLGEEWSAWTGLPFVYALWQVRSESVGTPELVELHDLLLSARDAAGRNGAGLATRAAARYGLQPDRLRRYWSLLTYTLGERELAGLRRFYQMAADIGEAPAPTEIRLVD